MEKAWLNSLSRVAHLTKISRMLQHTRHWKSSRVWFTAGAAWQCWWVNSNVWVRVRAASCCKFKKRSKVQSWWKTWPRQISAPSRHSSPTTSPQNAFCSIFYSNQLMKSRLRKIPKQKSRKPKRQSIVAEMRPLWLQPKMHPRNHLTARLKKWMPKTRKTLKNSNDAARWRISTRSASDRKKRWSRTTRIRFSAFGRTDYGTSIISDASPRLLTKRYKSRVAQAPPPRQ